MAFYTTQSPNFKQWQKLNQDLRFHLEMSEHGWADLYFDYQGKYYTISLSEVFDPFENLVHWIDDIAQNRLPAMIKIDEEAQLTELSANLIANDDIQFAIKDAIYGEQYFAITINRQALVRAFQIEIKRFFNQDFDPTHWDKRGYDEEDEEFYQDGLKEWVLNHEWK